MFASAGLDVIEQSLKVLKTKYDEVGVLRVLQLCSSFECVVLISGETAAHDNLTPLTSTPLQVAFVVGNHELWVSGKQMRKGRDRSRATAMIFGVLGGREMERRAFPIHLLLPPPVCSPTFSCVLSFLRLVISRDRFLAQCPSALLPSSLSSLLPPLFYSLPLRFCLSLRVRLSLSLPPCLCLSASLPVPLPLPCSFCFSLSVCLSLFCPPVPPLPPIHPHIPDPSPASPLPLRSPSPPFRSRRGLHGQAGPGRCERAREREREG